MPPKLKTTAQITTRSKAKELTSQTTEPKTSDICTCPSNMNVEQQEALEDLIKSLNETLRADLEKETTSRRHEMQLMRDSLDKNLQTKPPKSDLKPEFFSGNSNEFAGEWLDFYERIAAINNWNTALKLSAFPLYLRGVASTWYLNLSPDIREDFECLKNAFHERFTAGPNKWILLQQLGARKQLPSEPLDSYVADITRYCKRFSLSDEDSMRYLIDGLQGDLQTYVSLQRPKTFQEAEDLARIKDVVNKRQGVGQDQSVVRQLETILGKFSSKMGEPKQPAVVAARSGPSVEKRLENLSKQMSQLQRQQQQQVVNAYPLNAFGNSVGQPRSNGQAQAKPWVDQSPQLRDLQRQVARLENDLRRYQNPRRPDFRSYGRNFRGIEGDPICSFCQRIGHTWRSCRQRNGDPRIPNSRDFQSNPNFSRDFQPNPNFSRSSGSPNSRQSFPQGNA